LGRTVLVSVLLGVVVVVELFGLLGLLMFGLLGLGVMLLSVTPVRGCPVRLELSVVVVVVVLELIPLLAELSTTGPRCIDVSRAMPLFIFMLVSVIAEPAVVPVRVRVLRWVRVVVVLVLFRTVPLVFVSVTPGRML